MTRMSLPFGLPSLKQINRTVQRNPLYYGVPFILLMVGASFGLTTFTQTRYDLHDQRVKTVTKEQQLGLDKNKRKFDIREEYFKLSAESNEDWEPKRIQRPTGLPEWGVAPEKSPTPPPLTPIEKPRK